MPAIALKAAGTARIDINQIVRSLPDPLRSKHPMFGSFSVAYDWHWDGAISAEIQNTDSDRSLSYVSSLLPESEPSEATQAIHGVWWKKHASTGAFIRITNVTSKPLIAKLTLSDAKGKPVASASENIAIAPNRTIVHELPAILYADASAVGGIDMSYTGPSGGLIVDGGLEDADHGFSARIPLYPPSMTHRTSKPISIATTGIMIGQPPPSDMFPPQVFFRPWLTLRNVSSEAKDIKVAANYQMGPHSVDAQLTELTLHPLETVTVPVEDHIHLLNLLPAIMEINLSVSYEGVPSDVIISSGSVDDAGSYVFEVPPSLVGVGVSKDICFWKSGDGLDTMVSIWNHAGEPENLDLKLQFDGGSYRVPVRLEANSSATLNIFDILHSGVPDADGHTIPIDTEEGSAVLEGEAGETEYIDVTTTNAIYDVGHATCAFTCTNCNGYSGYYVFPAPWHSPFPSSTQLFGIAQFSSGNQIDFTSSSNWSSSNTGVASVSGGLVRPASSGTLTIYAETDDMPIPGKACGSPPDCSDNYAPLGGNSSGSIEDHTPINTGIYPGDWPAGSNTSVTITGEYFGTNAPTINLSPSSGISYSLQSYTDTQIVALVSVANGTPTEDVSVSITNNGYGGSGFYGGQQGNPSTSSSVYATVTNNTAGPVVTVIGWVNSAAPDISAVVGTGPSTAALKNNLTGGYVLCAFQLFRWSLGFSTNLNTAQDASYANAWLLQHSGNAAPPSSISVPAQFSGGDYRLFNSLGGSSPTYYAAGKTIFPCTTGGSFWDAAPQSSTYMGATGTVNGKQYQLAEGRLGSTGQKINQTINGRTTRWIWSVVELDSSGNPTTSDHAIFPTYSIYVNGVLQNTIPQTAASSFIANDQTYQRTPSQIQ